MINVLKICRQRAKIPFKHDLFGHKLQKEQNNKLK